MSPAWIVDSKDQTFVKYTANGYIPLGTGVGQQAYSNVLGTANTLSGFTGGTAVLDVGAAQALSDNTENVYAMRIGAFAVTAATTNNTITLGGSSGLAGILFNGTATDTVNFNFGANEGLLYVASGATVTLNGVAGTNAALTGSGGFTKFGAGALTIGGVDGGTAPGLAASLTGGIVTVDAGTVTLTNQFALGGTVSNAATPISAGLGVVLNGGGATATLLAPDVVSTYFVSDVTVNADSTINPVLANTALRNLTINALNTPSPATATGTPVVLTLGNTMAVNFFGGLTLKRTGHFQHHRRFPHRGWYHRRRFAHQVGNQFLDHRLQLFELCSARHD